MHASVSGSRQPPGPSRPLRVPLWLLALITFSGTLAMHIFVPALPVAAADLGAGFSAMQLTISFYILGLAIGQLIYGPLSDRFGRRPVLIVGLWIYAVTSFAAAVAPGIHALVAIRLLQALGGSAGLVLGRAIVRDGSSASEATKRLALMNMMVVIGPGLAPLIGTGLAAASGWRSIFIALSGFGFLNLLLTWRLLPETSSRQGFPTRTVLRNYRQLLSSRAFLGYAVGGGCATTSMYAFIGAAPFIFVGQLHRSAQEVGFYLAFNIFGVWLGSLAASWLAGRVTVRRLLVYGNLLSLCSAVAFLSTVIAGSLNVPATLATMTLFALGAGLSSPAALSEALSVNPMVAGSASGLYGATQMAVGAVCTSLAGIGPNPALSAALVLSIAGVVAQASFAWSVGSRRRDPAA